MADHVHGHVEHGHDHGGDCCDTDAGHDHGHAHEHGHAEHGHEHGHVDKDPDGGCCGGGLELDPVAFGGVDLSGDGGCLKKVLVEGDSEGGSPEPGDFVTVHYVGTLLDGSKFDSSRDRPGFFEFDVGVGRVIKGWDTGICSMKKGEKCVLACRADYAYGERGSPPTIPPNATLHFEVELFKWKQKRKEKATMDAPARLAEAEKAKAQGTVLFKAGKHEGALEKYEDAIYYVESDGEDASPIVLSCTLNAATCALKLAAFDKAVDCCTKALAIDADSVKAHFRRGSAYMRMRCFAEAKADLRRANTLDPKSKEVRAAFNECVAAEAEAKKSEKALYGKMLSKPSGDSDDMAAPKEAEAAESTDAVAEPKKACGG